MSFVAKILFSLTGPLTVSQFEAQCRDPRRAQEKLLRHILEKNQHTAFGTKHGFARIRTMKAFQRRVPLCTYEELKPYIEAERRGKKRQLTEEKPELFAKTSGTTGDAKYIPVTPESRQVKSDLMKVWLSAFYKDHPEILSERVLSIVSPEIEERAPDGTPCGSESGHAYRNIPGPVKALYACPYEVFEIEDYEARYYTILRIAAAQSLSLIVTVNPSTLVLLCEQLARHTKAIIRDIERGALSRKMKVPRRIREKIAPFLKADPERARELKRLAAENRHKLVPKAIWPKLAALACWQGGSVGTYLEKLKPCFPEGIPIRDLGYLASEHRGSVPLFDDADVGVLAIATNVYEFFPVEKERKPRRHELLTVDQVEAGKQYYVYVTTHGGLYRYDMNDIVEVVAYYHKTPTIRFVHKGQGVVSLTGEKLSETQVLTAVQESLRPIQGQYEFISAIGEMNDHAPRYVFLTEFNRTPPPQRLKLLLKSLEESLCRQNPEYAAKRKSLRLEPPLFRIVRPGSLQKYRQQVTKKGRPDGQFKILRLTDDEEFGKAFPATREVSLSGKRKAARRRKSSRQVTSVRNGSA